MLSYLSTTLGAYHYCLSYMLYTIFVGNGTAFIEFRSRAVGVTIFVPGAPKKTIQFKSPQYNMENGTVED